MLVLIRGLSKQLIGSGAQRRSDPGDV